MVEKYTWINPNQKLLFDDFTKVFGSNTLVEVGKLTGVKNPYHAAKQIFSSEMLNRNMVKILELQKKSKKIIL